MKKFLSMLAAMAALVGVTYAEDEDSDEADGPDMRPMAYIDAKSIQNKTDNSKANFSGLCDRLNNALVETGVYRVLSEEDIARITDADGLLKVVSEDKKDVNVNVPGFRLTMTVMTYGDTKSTGHDMMSGAGKVENIAKIELILKVVDMRTAETVKSKNIEGSARGKIVAVGKTEKTESNLTEQLLQAATKDVCNKIVKELIMLTPFGIMGVDDGKVLVDVPAGLAKEYKTLDVKKCGKRIKNKRTGKWTYPEKKVATLKVEDVTEDTVSCAIVDGEVKPDEDADEGCEYDKYRVRISGTTDVAKPVVSAPVAPTSSEDPF